MHRRTALKRKRQTSTKLDGDLRLLLRTLEQLGVDIRTEPCDSEGGLVRVQDRYMLFVNNGIGIDRRKRLCLDALRRFDTRGLHLPPRLRELLHEEEWG